MGKMATDYNFRYSDRYGGATYKYDYFSRVVTDLESANTFREGYCFNRTANSFNVFSALNVASMYSTGTSADPPSTYRSGPYSGNTDALIPIKYKNNLGMYISDGFNNGMKYGNNLSTVGIRKLQGKSGDYYYKLTGYEGTYNSLGGFVIPSNDVILNDNYTIGTASLANNGSFIDFDFDKLVVYWKCKYYDKSTNTLGEADWKTVKENDNYIPCAIKPLIYYGNSGTRALTPWSVKFCTVDGSTNIGIEHLPIFGLSSQHNYEIYNDDRSTTEVYNPYISVLTTSAQWQPIPSTDKRVRTNKMRYIGHASQQIARHKQSTSLCEMIMNYSEKDETIFDSDSEMSTNLSIDVINGRLIDGSKSYVFNVEQELGMPYINCKLLEYQYSVGTPWTSGLRDGARDGVNFVCFTKEYIDKLIGMYGLYYTDVYSSIQSELGENCTDPNIHLMEITEHGTHTDNKIYSGAEIPLNLAYALQSDITNTPYTYSADEGTDEGGGGDTEPEDTNSYVNAISLNTPSLTNLGVFNTAYAINYNTANSFSSWIWNADDTEFDAIKENLKMYNNPMDAVVSLTLFPFDVVQKAKSGIGGDRLLVLGRTRSDLYGKQLLPNYSCILDFGTCVFPTKYKNFMDYSPYTKAYLYIPYCGITEINPSQFIGKTISVKMAVDIQTATCTAVIYGNDIPYQYLDGVIGIQVPTSSTNVVQTLYARQNNTTQSEVQSNANMLGGIGGALSNISSGNPLGAVTSLLGMSNASQGIKSQSIMNQINTKGSIEKSGASTPICSFYQPQRCYFIIDRPTYNIPINYGHTVGYVANYTAKLNTLNGFTVCNNPHLDNINCTATEKQMILNELANGVIV